MVAVGYIANSVGRVPPELSVLYVDLCGAVKAEKSDVTAFPVARCPLDDL